MGGDYTRFTFAPGKNYSGVWKQQGRVRADADENELSDIVDRRWRAETQDIIGRCAVPATTVDGFRIVPTGAGTFDILVGRLYADGLLAENHGRDPLQDRLQPRGDAWDRARAVLRSAVLSCAPSSGASGHAGHDRPRVRGRLAAGDHRD